MRTCLVIPSCLSSSVRIEQDPSKVKVVGSNPTWGAMKIQDLTGFTPAEIKKMAKIVNDLRPDAYGYIQFDYPDYGGIPEHINRRLTGEQVDLIQEEVQYVDREIDELFMAKLLARGWWGN